MPCHVLQDHVLLPGDDGWFTGEGQGWEAGRGVSSSTTSDTLRSGSTTPDSAPDSCSASQATGGPVLPLVVRSRSYAAVVAAQAQDTAQTHLPLGANGNSPSGSPPTGSPPANSPSRGGSAKQPRFIVSSPARSPSVSVIEIGREGPHFCVSWLVPGALAQYQMLGGGLGHVSPERVNGRGDGRRRGEPQASPVKVSSPETSELDYELVRTKHFEFHEFLPYVPVSHFCQSCFLVLSHFVLSHSVLSTSACHKFLCCLVWACRRWPQ